MVGIEASEYMTLLLSSADGKTQRSKCIYLGEDFPDLGYSIALDLAEELDFEPDNPPPGYTGAEIDVHHIDLVQDATSMPPVKIRSLVEL